MRYRVRTLLILAALAPPILAGLIWMLVADFYPELRDRPRTAAARKATEDLRKLFATATRLEIVEAGSAFQLRSNSLEGDSLTRLADSAVITEVQVTNILSTGIAGTFITFRLLQDDEVLHEYTFQNVSCLIDSSPPHNRDGYWTVLEMSEMFSRTFVRELTSPAP